MTKQDKRLRRPGDSAYRLAPLERCFRDGERLSYSVTLLGILAGRAAFEVQGDQLVHRERASSLLSLVQSEGTFGKLVKLKLRYESFVTPQTLRPRYVRMSIESSRSRDVALRYDHEKLRSSGIIRWPNGKRRRYGTFITERALDPLSAAYWVRCQKLKLKDNIELEVYNGRRLYSVTLVVARRELVTAGRVTYRTLAIRGTVHLWRPPTWRRIAQSPDGPARSATSGKPVGNFWLYLTDDHNRIPVKLTFLSRYGPLEATLAGVSSKRTK